MDVEDCSLDCLDVMEGSRSDYFRDAYGTDIREAVELEKSHVQQETDLRVVFLSFLQNDVKSFEEKRTGRSKEGTAILEGGE